MEPSLFHTQEPHKFTSSMLEVISPQPSLENMLSSILPSQTEETQVSKTRKHLGKIGEQFSDEQIQCMITEFQFLIDTWMDEFEREIFNGMTLKEVLNGT